MFEHSLICISGLLAPANPHNSPACNRPTPGCGLPPAPIYPRATTGGASELKAQQVTTE